MDLDYRRLLIPLLFLAAGLAGGVYIARSGTQVPGVTAYPQKTGDTDRHAENGTGTAPSADAKSNPSTPNANSTSPAPNANAALEKMRADYYEQIGKGESRQALLILQDMEKKAPGSQIYLETSSDYFIYVKDWTAAAAASKKCTEVFPSSRPCYRNLGNASLQSGTKEDQLTAADNCLALEPNDPQCRNIKGLALMNSGDYPGAVIYFKELIDDNGNYGVRFPEDMLEWHLGLALEGAGKRDEAIDHMENACRRNNNQACNKIEELSGGGLN